MTNERAPAAERSAWSPRRTFADKSLGAPSNGEPGRRVAVSGRQRRVEQAQTVSRGRGLAAAAHTELGQDVRDVHACGLGGDEELGGDLRVRPPGGDEAQHLELPGGEAKLGRHGAAGIVADPQREPGAPGQYR